MTVLSPFLFWAALCVGSLFFTSKGMKGGVAPLCAVCAAGLAAALGGCLGVLPLAGWLVYLAAAAAGVYLVVRHGVKKTPLPRPGLGFWFFAGGGLLLLLVLAVRQPMLLSWDEFSTWGTSAKLMKLYGELYTTAPIGWAWPATQPPFSMCMAWLPQLFSPSFTEWQVYFGIDLLMLACVAALAAPLKKKHWNLAMPLFLLGFLAPFLFTIYQQPAKVAPPWLDSLADVPMGMLFGGVLAAWFGGEKKGVRGMLPVCLSLAALTLMKETALALALVAAVLIFVDSVGQKRTQGITKKGHWLPALGRLGIHFACVLLPFLGWAAYLKLAGGVNRFALGGVNNVGMTEMPFAFIRDLLSPQKNQHFIDVVTGMPKLFLTSMGSMLGSGAMIALFIVALCAFAAWLAGPGAQRRRCVLYAVFSSLGFVPYFLLITLTYIYIFRPEQIFESFERYLYPYYIGWFLGALALVILSAREGKRALPGKAAVLALSLLLGVRCFTVVPPVYSIVGMHRDEYNGRRAFNNEVSRLTAGLDPEGKTFIVSTGDDGMRWFTYCYAFLPWQVDYSYGGGEFLTREQQKDGTTLKTHIGPEAWQAHLLKEGCTTVLIDDADEVFREEYGEVFSDGMKGYFKGETRLYAVEAEGGGTVLTPMGMPE